MRALDNLITYFDNEMNPLHGRLTFFKLHTTDKVVVTTETGVALDNPIHTGETGKTSQQVFLPDEDITVLVEKYIGGGNMSDDEDNLSAWSEQYTFDSLKNTVVINTDEGLVMAANVPTMESLRAADISVANYAVLYGYYNLGDMPPITYKLAEDTISTDDGGSIIRMDASHVWMLVPKQVIDCRIFGVFPSVDMQTLTAYNSRLRLCFSYANTMGLSVYIPQVYDSQGYYYIEGGSFTLHQTLYIDSGVMIVAKPGTNSTLTVDEIQYHGRELFKSNNTYGILRVNCPVVKSSWKSSGWEGWNGTIKRIIVDYLDWTFTITGTEVEFTTNLSGNDVNLTDCKILYSGGKLSNCLVNLNNCGDVSDNFIGDNVTVFLHNNVIKLENMSSANAYVQWKNRQGEADYGNLGEQTINGVSLRDGCIVENATFESVTLLGSAELHNVSGSLTISGTNSTQNWVDCWISISANAVVSSFALRRGAISGHNITAYFEFIATDADLSSQMQITCFPTVKRCKINGRIIQNAVSGIFDGIFESCIFSNVQELITSAENAIVNVKWLNNYSDLNLSSYTHGPILFGNYTNFAEAESAHGYVYENNTGSFLPSSKSVRFQTTLSIASTGTGLDNVVFARSIPYLGDNTVGVVAFANAINPPNRHGITGINLFRVGKDSFNVKCTWEPYQSSPFVFTALIPQTFVMRMVHKDTGYFHEYNAYVPKFTSTAAEPPFIHPTVIALLQHEDVEEFYYTTGSISGIFTFER